MKRLTIIIFLLSLFPLYAIAIPPSPAGGNCLVLDGKDDYAILDFDEYGTIFKGETRELTFEAWIYPTTYPQGFVHTVVLNQQIHVFLGEYNDDNLFDRNFRAEYGWKKGDYLINVFHDSRINGEVIQVGPDIGIQPNTISPYEWHYIALQIRKDKITWIWDEESKTLQWGGWMLEPNVYCPIEDFVIGGYGKLNTHYGSYAGYIDEVRFSKVPRYDITKKINIPKGKFTSDSDTVALWHFDELIGSQAFYDSSENKYLLIGKNGSTTEKSLSVDSKAKLTTTWGRMKK